MSFAMIIPRKPISSQSKSARNRENYKLFIASQARDMFSATPFTGDLYARIIWFYKGRYEGDVDNIIKPILDAIRGIVYQDDRLVVKCASERFDKTRDITIPQVNISDNLYEEMLLMIADDAIQHSIYIEIGVATSREVVFGPIDGGII